MHKQRLVSLVTHSGGTLDTDRSENEVLKHELNIDTKIDPSIHYRIIA